MDTLPLLFDRIVAVANLILIPMFSLYAASWVTVASELVLMAPLYLWTRTELGTMPNLLALSWLPINCLVPLVNDGMEARHGTVAWSAGHA